MTIDTVPARNKVLLSKMNGATTKQKVARNPAPVPGNRRQQCYAFF